MSDAKGKSPEMRAWRVEVAVLAHHRDPAADGWLSQIALALPEVRTRIQAARLVEVYWVYGPWSDNVFQETVQEIFSDPVLSSVRIEAGAPLAGNGIEKRFLPGVTDNVAATLREAFEIVLGKKEVSGKFASGALLLLESAGDLSESDLKKISTLVFANPLIESVQIFSQKTGGPPASRFELEENLSRWKKYSVSADTQGAKVETFDLCQMSDDSLQKLSQERLWALSLEEMKAIQAHYRTALNARAATDVEMEVLAQTWSEHCKHKIFNAEISYSDQSGDPQDLGARIPARVKSLFKQTIAGTTRELPRPWLLSVFSDNAGIIALDEDDAVCIKVETHNSPSALDPYGGALTGIVGVNRDILGCGLGARPIFNTDVFCVAYAPPPATPRLPEGLLHPRRILDGVRRGVEHGGNKSGIPTVNGALVFDDRYLGKPLVYCGTGGILPRKILGRDCSEKKILVGDRICMVGGRIGKDGIHGATFSSLAMDENSPVSAVQLGDPMTQKRVIDFLLEARDLGLYRALTDNGAGGLSSSVGELAQLSGGAKMDVGLARTKYPGLVPYELTVSESQERMTVAVDPKMLASFLELASRRSVEVSDLGEFTDHGKFEILYQGKPVGVLDLNFLHSGAPQLKIQAEWKGPGPAASLVPQGGEEPGKIVQTLKSLLSHPNIASKEWLIRQYDHEVQAATVVKPLQTAFPGTSQEKSGPNDAGVVQPKPNSRVGVVIGCGINPKFSDQDAYLMALHAVDEAVRNVLCVGGEFGKDGVLSLVDNFCWPDPLQDKAKAAALVRACFGLREACLELGIPLVSGKDSMKNDFRGRYPDGTRAEISVPPTLLMTAMGRIPDVAWARTAEFKRAGDVIYRLEGLSLRPEWNQARALYGWLGESADGGARLLNSVHDISEGGLLVAVAESCFPRNFGVQIHRSKNLFEEAFHGFVVSVDPSVASDLERQWKARSIRFDCVGKVTDDGWFVIDGREKIETSELRTAWNRRPL